MGKGRFPYRRTVEFLNAGTLRLRGRVQTIAVNLTSGKSSNGLRNFVMRDIPQIQYKNPHKQIVCFRDKEEFPNLTLWCVGGEKELIDVEGKSADQIVKLLELAASATESELLRKEVAKVKYPGRINAANFGKNGHCFCICEKPGQVPCPSRVKFDKPRKWWHDKNKEEE